MTAALFALTAAFFFGMAGTILRRALAHINPLTAACASITVTAAVTWVLAAFTDDLSLVVSPAVIPFIIAGAIAPGLARLLLFIGYDRVGVGRGMALVATTPLWAILIAVLFLGERPGGLMLAGAGLIVASSVVMAVRAAGDTSWRRRHMLYPLLAAVGFGTRDAISRAALVDFHHPLVGAAAATFMSVTTIWVFAAVQRGMRGLSFNAAGTRLSLLSGTCEGLAYVTMWRALALGDVSVVVPLVNATPMFTVVLVLVLLRGVERMTWRIALASLMSVAGVFLIVLGRR